MLNEVVAEKRKIMPFHRRADQRLSDIQKRLVFITSAFLEKADELILTQSKTRPLNFWKVMALIIYILNKYIRSLCDQKTSDAIYFFCENPRTSMKETKESFRISNIQEFLAVSLQNFRKLAIGQVLHVFLGTPILALVPVFCLPLALKRKVIQ